jgi:hypothetical protein
LKGEISDETGTCMHRNPIPAMAQLSKEFESFLDGEYAFFRAVDADDDEDFIEKAPGTLENVDMF